MSSLSSEQRYSQLSLLSFPLPFESLITHTFLIMLPGEGGKSTLTCKALKCLACVTRAFLCFLVSLCSPGWDRLEQSTEGGRLWSGAREKSRHGARKGVGGCLSPAVSWPQSSQASTRHSLQDACGEMLLTSGMAQANARAGWHCVLA